MTLLVSRDNSKESRNFTRGASKWDCGMGASVASTLDSFAHQSHVLSQRMLVTLVGGGWRLLTPAARGRAISQISMNLEAPENWGSSGTGSSPFSARGFVVSCTLHLFLLHVSISSLSRGVASLKNALHVLAGRPPRLSLQYSLPAFHPLLLPQLISSCCSVYFSVSPNGEQKFGWQTSSLCFRP